MDEKEILKLKELTKELSDILEYSIYEIYIIAHDTNRYLYANQGACEALGYTKNELYEMTTYDVNPKLTKQLSNEIKEKLKTQSHIIHRTIHKPKNGSVYYAHSLLHPVKFKGQDAYLIYDTDISETVELEQKYKQQSSILDQIHDGVITTNLDGGIISWNDGARKIFGYTKEEVCEQNISLIYHSQKPLKELLKILRKEGEYSFEATLNNSNNEDIICDISLSPLRDDEQNITAIIGFVRDVTEKKETQTILKQQALKLNHQANHDALTGLPNRTLFEDRLEQSIASAKRNGEKFALMFLDLDQFKKINDSLGHHVGDTVLIEASTRLHDAIREEDTLSRLGGDEFTLIIKDMHKKEDLITVAKKIIQSMKKPIQASGHSLFVTTSIGIAIYPDDTTNKNDLIKFSDTAMYKAKDEGRDNYQFYSSEMTSLAFERVVMESSLRIAIKERQFIVYYQPQIDARTNTIIGVEALIRWRHPVMGLVSPAKFIPIAEDSGLITKIDMLVMEEAMKQVANWYDQGLKPGILSLNLAMKQLGDENYISKLLNMMQDSNFQPKWLELEVTETQMMKNPNESIRKLKDISTLGIEIAIDDFGTGYSSLSYLKKLPLNKLKIDQSFVKDILIDEDDEAITKAIISLGQSLNLKLIAEGVEYEEQKEFLLKNGCYNIQGYYYSKPLPEEEMTLFLQEQANRI